MKNNWIWFVLLMFLVSKAGIAVAQESSSAHIIGIGNTNILDTYISQEKYKGTGLTYLYIHEGKKPGKHWQNTIEHEADFSKTKDRKSMIVSRIFFIPFALFDKILPDVII